MTVRASRRHGFARGLLGLLVAPLPVVVVLVITTAMQNARGGSVVATALSLAPTLGAAVYAATLVMATLVALPVLYAVARFRGRRVGADVVAVGGGTGVLAMLGYHTALTGLSLDVDGLELLRLLAIGAGLGALSGGLGFLVLATGRGPAPVRGSDRPPVA